jgi:apolipoprotein D and lipocalin family protein
MKVRRKMKYVQYFGFWGLAVLLLFIAIVGFMGCYSMRNRVDLTPVRHFNLTRFLGKWYEIARFDHWFEREMSHVTATYTLREDGGVSVFNSGRKDGKLKVATGKGKLTNQQALLKVSFYWPFYGDYRILWVDENYQHALVGGGNSEYLWILSRTPTIDSSVKNTILFEAIRRGYEVDKLIWVEQ